MFAGKEYTVQFLSEIGNMVSYSLSLSNTTKPKQLDAQEVIVPFNEFSVELTNSSSSNNKQNTY